MDSQHVSFDSQLVVAPLNSKPAYHPPPPTSHSVLLPQAGSFDKSAFHCLILEYERESLLVQITYWRILIFWNTKETFHLNSFF